MTFEVEQGSIARRRVRRFRIALLAIGFAAALPLLAAFLQPWLLQVCPASDPSQCLGEFMRELKWIGLLGATFFMIVSGLTLLPDEIAAIANGLGFGPWIGSVISWTGAMASANIAYLFGRRVGTDAVSHIIGEGRANKLIRWVERRGVLALIALRLLPLVPALAVSFSAGALRMSLTLYNVVTGICIIPTLIVFSFAGGYLWSTPLSVWLSLLLAAGLLLAIVIIFRRKPKALRKILQGRKQE